PYQPPCRDLSATAVAVDWADVRFQVAWSLRDGAEHPAGAGADRKQLVEPGGAARILDGVEGPGEVSGGCPVIAATLALLVCSLHASDSGTGGTADSSALR